MKCLIGAIARHSLCFLPSFWLSVQISQLISTFLSAASLLVRPVLPRDERPVTEATVRPDPATDNVSNSHNLTREQVEKPIQYPNHVVRVFCFYECRIAQIL